ncbi:MAG: hypothetical protein JO069_14115 [Verrucomicrobia bacterium]|nr:hypothetical protein [Verrucomicrobiota bacterium]
MITQEPIDKTNEVFNPTPQGPTAPDWSRSVPVESGSLTADLPPPPVRGRTLALWLDEEDCAILGKMLALARSQGLEPTDALILRALLRLGPQHPGALDQIRILLERVDCEPRCQPHEPPDRERGPKLR